MNMLEEAVRAVNSSESQRWPSVMATIAGVRLAASVAFQVSSDHDRSDPIMSTLSANAGSAHSA
jgi:hypothetical protein